MPQDWNPPVEMSTTAPVEHPTKVSIYEDYIQVPRALLVTCADLLEGMSTRVLPNEDDDYELVLAQLRAHLG